MAPTLLVAPTTDNATVFASDRVAAWQGLIASDFRRATPRFNDTMPVALDTDDQEVSPSRRGSSCVV